ncbi:MAG: cyclic nucleotide-binding domain-containing protein [Alphaproteobacteria bacterium]|nr:cyclic nucleotide-binding domain-containing protein [Alphaproteobacteria bacterium]
MAEISSLELSDLDVVGIIAEHPLLSRLPPELQEMLAERVKFRELVPAEAITREGSVATRWYLLIEGEARVSRTRPTGAQEVLARLKAGALLGCVGLADGAPRPTTIAAVGPARCLEFPRALLRGEPRSPEGRLALALWEILGLAMNLQLRAANQRLYVMGRRLQGHQTDPGAPELDFGGWVQPD